MAQLAPAMALNHESLFRFALALTRSNQDEAHDIVQQAYVEVLEGRAAVGEARNPKAFMLGVVRRIAASKHRRRSIWARVLRMEFSNELALAKAWNPDDPVETDQLTTKIRRAMMCLPARQLEVATLVFAEDMTLAQAAQVMNVSVGTARCHYHRAKKRLFELLNGSDEP